MSWVRVILFGLCAFGLGWWLPLGDVGETGSETVVTERRIADGASWDEGAWRQWQEDMRHKEIEAAYEREWARDVMAGVVLEP